MKYLLISSLIQKVHFLLFNVKFTSCRNDSGKTIYESKDYCEQSFCKTKVIICQSDLYD